MNNIYQFVSNLHGYVAIMASFLLILITLVTIVYFFNHKKLSFLYKKIALYTLITFHIQLLLGVAMLFLNSGLMQSFTKYQIQGKISLMEHIPSNFTVVLLVTVFYSITKRSSKAKIVMPILLIISLILLGRTFILLHGVLE